MEHEHASVGRAVVMEQFHDADRAVAIGESPLARAGRIERQPADAEHPPNVHERLRLREQKVEELTIAGDRLDGQPAKECRRPQAGLGDVAVGSRHPVERDRLHRPRP